MTSARDLRDPNLNRRRGCLSNFLFSLTHAIPSSGGRKAPLRKSTSERGVAGASPTHKKSDSWAKRSAKLASIVQRSPRPRPNSPPPSPPSPDLSAAGNLICGFAYKRNLHFGYKKRFIAIDTGSGCFYYFSTHPSGPEASSQTPLSSLNRAQLESSPYLKVHCAAGEWTLSDCPDDDGGFFIFKGAATGNLQTKLGRLNSMFFKVIIDEKRQLVQTTHNPISSESSHADMEADFTSKEVWLKTAADLSARGSDTFLHSHISIKGLTQTEKTKRYRKTNLRSPDGKLIATQELEHKLKPRVHYPSTWMTDDEMMTEVIKPTEKLHDTTRRTPQSTLESSLGKVEVELLQCFGLPKLDRFGKTDAYAVMCVGSSHFRTETIDDNYSPIFLPKVKRGAIFNIGVPYEKLYVSIFDDDGDFLQDDFCGRVEIDLARIKPFISYDVSLKMRYSDSIYDRKPRGIIRLRLKITSWTADTMSLLKSWSRNFLSRKEGSHIVCSDKAMARQIAFTCWGTDIPGEYTPRLFRGTIREMDIYEINFLWLAKKTVYEIAMYECPGPFGIFKSIYVFLAWQWVGNEGIHAYFTSVLGFWVLILMENFFYREPIGFAKPGKATKSSALIAPSLSSFSFDSDAGEVPTGNNEFPFCDDQIYPTMNFNACLARKLKTGTGLITMLEETFVDPAQEDAGETDYDDLDGLDLDDGTSEPPPDPSGLFTRHLTSKVREGDTVGRA